MKARQNLFLCGFMGCGKSAVGSAIASRYGMEQIDLDAYIEKQEGRSIAAIFASDGEEAFRAIEAEALRRVAQSAERTVISCGGGALLNKDSAKIARKNGEIILLDAPFPLCYRRIAHDTDRPLATKRSEAELRLLYAFRQPIYQKCATRIISIAEGETPAMIAERIMQK